MRLYVYATIMELDPHILYMYIYTVEIMQH